MFYDKFKYANTNFPYAWLAHISRMLLRPNFVCHVPVAKFQSHLICSAQTTQNNASQRDWNFSTMLYRLCFSGLPFYQTVAANFVLVVGITAVGIAKSILYEVTNILILKWYSWCSGDIQERQSFFWQASGKQTMPEKRNPSPLLLKKWIMVGLWDNDGHCSRETLNFPSFEWNKGMVKGEQLVSGIRAGIKIVISNFYFQANKHRMQYHLHR